MDMHRRCSIFFGRLSFVLGGFVLVCTCFVQAMESGDGRASVSVVMPDLNLLELLAAEGKGAQPAEGSPAGSIRGILRHTGTPTTPQSKGYEPFVEIRGLETGLNCCAKQLFFNNIIHAVVATIVLSFIVTRHGRRAEAYRHMDQSLQDERTKNSNEVDLV